MTEPFNANKTPEQVIFGLIKNIEALDHEVEAIRAACKGVIAWDKRRKFIIPYSVRDPIHAAIANVKG